MSTWVTDSRDSDSLGIQNFRRPGILEFRIPNGHSNRGVPDCWIPGLQESDHYPRSPGFQASRNMEVRDSFQESGNLRTVRDSRSPGLRICGCSVVRESWITGYRDPASPELWDSRIPLLQDTEFWDSKNRWFWESSTQRVPQRPKFLTI